MSSVIEPRTHYSDIGTGPALIFIHALGLNTEMWNLQAPALAPRYRVISYDARGHGLTPYGGEPLTIWTLANDLLELMNRLEIERAAIIGLSIGGMIAQAFGISHPERVAALGLISSVSAFGDAGRTGLLERATTVEREGMEPMIAPAVERWFTEEFRARALADPLPQGAAASIEAEADTYEASVIAAIGNMITTADPKGYAAAGRALAETDLTPDLLRISCPTLIMSGEKDPGISRQSQETLKAGIPNSTEIIIPNCSHLVAIECASDFNTHLVNFLAWCGYV